MFIVPFLMLGRKEEKREGSEEGRKHGRKERRKMGDRKE